MRASASRSALSAPLARFTAWYSGLYERNGAPAVGDFEGALVWSALTFSKPWGECGGETGYWADPPES